MTSWNRTLLLLLSVLVPNSSSAVTFTFSSESGGAQTRITLSGTSTATQSIDELQDGSLPFDFITSMNNVFFPNATALSLTGSMSGTHTGVSLRLDHDGNPGQADFDDLHFIMGTPFLAGELLTGAGTDVANIPFGQFVSGGDASSPSGAPFDIVIVPEPSSLPLCGLGLATLLAWRRTRLHND